MMVMILLRLWLILSWSVAAPLNPTVYKEVIEENSVKDAMASVVIVDGVDETVDVDSVDDYEVNGDGLQRHTDSNANRDPRLTVNGGNLIVSGTVNADHAQIAYVIASEVSEPGTSQDHDHATTSTAPNTHATSSTAPNTHVTTSTAPNTHVTTSTAPNTHVTTSTAQNTHATSTTAPNTHVTTSTAQNTHATSSTAPNTHVTTSTAPNTHVTTSTAQNTHAISTTAPNTHATSTTAPNTHATSTTAANTSPDNQPASGTNRGWSGWSSWSSCNATCGPATKKRERTCTEPAPANGGDECQGYSQEVADCGLNECRLEQEDVFLCSFKDKHLVGPKYGDGAGSPHNPGAVFQWKDNIIPYYFTSVSSKDKDLFRSVMDIIEENTCFKFEEKTKDEYEREHSLEITTGSKSCSIGCHGSVGRVKYSQRLLLFSATQMSDKEECELQCKGFVLHELLHALGVGHTFIRSDRDDYITINEANIDSLGISLEYFAKCEDCILYPEIPYDCDSIMHYGTHVVSTEIMTPKNPNTCNLKKQAKLFDGPKASVLDWKLLNIIGKCAINSAQEKACNKPPPSPYTSYGSYGSWDCEDDFTSCKLICDSGYVPSNLNPIKCINGHWVKPGNYICSPFLSNKVYLLAGGKDSKTNVELYNPSLGSPSCSSPPPQLPKDWSWSTHTSFIHDSTVYICGGISTASTCRSLHTSTASSWTTHYLPSPVGVGLSSVVLGDKVVFLGGRSSGVDLSATYTTLPISNSTTLTPVPNLSYRGKGLCAAELNATSFIISGGWYYDEDGRLSVSTVLLYDLETETVKQLASLTSPRWKHACITVQQEGKMWLIVTGGAGYTGTLASAQRLDIETNTWEDLGDLKEARGGHTMINSENRGVIVLGGYDVCGNELSSVEVLAKREWQRIEPSLVTARSNFGGAVEVSADFFSCDLYLKSVCNPKREGSCSCGDESCEEGQICVTEKCLDVCEIKNEELLTADCFCIHGEGGVFCPKGDGSNKCSQQEGCKMNI